MPPKVVEASPKGTLEALLIGYTYAKVTVRIIETEKDYKVYIDTGYS
jgi:hypothetical protein